jgi:hypothetical protein
LPVLTSLNIRNLKRFEEVEVELSNPVLFVGPNDAGKTSALQALMLWDLGLRRWSEKAGRKTAPEKRPGVAITGATSRESPPRPPDCSGAGCTFATPRATSRTVSGPTTCASMSVSMV